MSPHWFPRRTWPLALPLVLALTVTPAAGASATPDPGGQPPATAPAPAGAGQSLTLVTGDQVWLSPAGQGRWAATVDPAPRAGQEPTFETFEVGEDVYIVPSDAAPLVPERLDRELFNVAKLAEYGYTDGVPVIVTGAPARAFTALITPNRAPPAGADTVSLRVAVADEDGNRLEQEIIDAWRLP